MRVRHRWSVSARVRRLLVATGLAALVVAVPVVGAYAEVPATGVTVTGRVIGPDGAAVQGASVTPQLDGVGSLPAVVTGADGTYALRNLVPGSYALLVGARPDTGLMSGYYPDGGTPEVPARLTVTTAPTQVAPDTRLQRGATVAGTIRRLDGTPVPYADVWVDLVGPGGYSFPATTTYRFPPAPSAASAPPAGTIGSREAAAAAAANTCDGTNSCAEIAPSACNSVAGFPCTSMLNRTGGSIPGTADDASSTSRNS